MNQSYFLLPISTQKYVDIVQPNLTLKQKFNGPLAVLKNNYTKLSEVEQQYLEEKAKFLEQEK